MQVIFRTIIAEAALVSAFFVHIQVAAAQDISLFCAAFKEAGAADLDLSSKEAWEKRLANTAKLVTAAPTEQQENAQVYLKLVKDRLQLVAQYNYVAVPQLPSAARNQFIAEHQPQQAQANLLINYANKFC